MEKTNAVVGDYVEIHLTKLIYEGVLLEVPKSEKGVILLKLDSGYNIGFNKKDILKIVVLRKEKERKEEFEIKKDNEKPNIAMIITGGTIASRLDSKTGGVHPLQKPEDLFKFYPDMFKKVNVVKVEVPFMKASEDMNFKDWQKIAKVAEKLLNDSNIKGIIITHGTDFLHYTSAALSFFLRDLNKPVVLTYSQRSIDRASSDANLNLQCSALVAISDIAEVCLVGHASMNDNFCYAMPGTKVRKLHTSRRDAFKVVNDEPFAKVFTDRIEIMNEFHHRAFHRHSPDQLATSLTYSLPPSRGEKVSIREIARPPRKNNKKSKVFVDAKFEEKVALVKVYPGQSPEILDYYVKKKYKGLVLEMSGLGHVPTRDSKNSWLTKLKDVQKKGIVVCATSQCIYGRVDPLVYSNGREILKIGVIYLEDMLSETALVKLGWVLGHAEWAKDKKIVKEKMLNNFAGELNDRLEE